MIKKNSLKSTMTVTNFKTVVAWFHSRLAAQKALSSPIPDCLGLWLLIRCFKANRACGTWQLYCGIPTTAADCCSRPASGVGERKHTNSPTLLQKPEIRALSVFLLGTGLGFCENIFTENSSLLSWSLPWTRIKHLWPCCFGWS